MHFAFKKYAKMFHLSRIVSTVEGNKSTIITLWLAMIDFFIDDI